MCKNVQTCTDTAKFVKIWQTCTTSVKICQDLSKQVKQCQNLSSSVKLSEKVQILQNRDSLSEFVPNSIENVRRLQTQRRKCKTKQKLSSSVKFSETVQIPTTKDSFAPNDSGRYQNHMKTAENTQNSGGNDVVVC